MQLIILALHKPNATPWLEKLLEAGEVVAPVRGPGGDVVFSAVTSPDQVLWDFGNPLPPPKQFVLPQTDPLVKIQRTGQGYQVEPIYDDQPRALFNLRSCDVKGIVFLTRMHQTEPADASFLRRARHLTLISLACNHPCPLGFCVCTDSGPFLTDGYDVQLPDLGEDYLVEVGTDRGQAVIAHVPNLFRAATESEVS